MPSTPQDRTLADAVKGADMFLGLSVGGALTPDMLKTMNKDPIVFACANPDPEIHPEEALAARSDVIISTGRSDYPNQVNNVLGFPFIFRGALDVDASDVNEEMKMAASTGPCRGCPPARHRRRAERLQPEKPFLRQAVHHTQALRQTCFLRGVHCCCRGCRQQRGCQGGLSRARCLQKNT